jgi:alpha-amylase
VSTFVNELTVHANHTTPNSTSPMAVRKALRGVAVFLGLAIASAAQADVILHAFNWKYADVTARASAIQSAGYKVVMVAPAYRSEGAAWWGRYQPQDQRLIDSPLGDTATFTTMVSTLQQKGIRVYADILLNHMANESSKRPDLNYPGQALLNTYAGNTTKYSALKLYGDLRYNYLSASDFGPTVCITDYNNTFQVQNYRLCGGGADVGLPDLLGSDYVVAQQQAYLLALKNIGVKGFRIDAAKHMSISHINRVLSASIKSGVFVFGEVITSGGAGNSEYDNFLKPYLDNTGHGAYDFPLHNQIRTAFGFNGSMSNLVDPGAYGQALAADRAVTFTLTHDIPNNGGFRYLIMDATDETLAYAYIIGRGQGSPMVYSDNNESGDNRWVNAYARTDLKNMIGFHNAMQGTDFQVLSHGSCHLIFRRGNVGIVGINKCGNTVSASINTNNSVLWWNANYTDQLGSGSVVNISGGSYTFTLPARSARMWKR